MDKGSVINRIMEGSSAEEIKVGMGATALFWSDRQAFTVIEIKSKSRILVQRDRVKILAVMPAQEWEIEPDSQGEIWELIKTKKGWKKLKSSIYVRVGVRDEYYDSSF